MKTIFLLITIALLTANSYCQNGEWTWMNGNNVYNPAGHYGTQGVFDPLNTPPALYETCEWTDLHGNFWLFGGSQLGENLFGDLWEFKPSINQWAWMKGTELMNQPPVYGIQGVPSPTNEPGGRGFGILTWVDYLGDLYLMGGSGYSGCLNDLWKYNIVSNEWTWMKGPDTVNGKGIYGLIGIEDTSNCPPARNETSASWTDNDYNLWFFGGITFDSLYNFLYFNDLWKYNLGTNDWTWMKGSNHFNQLSVYGTKGIPNSANVPSGRQVYAKWKDSRGNFWMFGGDDSVGFKNDMWKYDILSNQWTWMSGTNESGNTGISGTQCVGDILNVPSARWENRAVWTRDCDNFEMFGGGSPVTNLISFAYNSFNDLWNYNVSTNQWTWMNGSLSNNPMGNYGIKTVSNPVNLPPSRAGSNSWKDNSGNLWMFGGLNDSLTIMFNDLWRFVPDTTCPLICLGEGIPQVKSEQSVSVYPNPCSNSITLSYISIAVKTLFQIYDVTGRIIYHRSISGNEGKEIIDVSNISSGVYFYLIKNDKETLQGKFVKQ